VARADGMAAFGVDSPGRSTRRELNPA
jgi:hypothetical protein